MLAFPFNYDPYDRVQREHKNGAAGSNGASYSVASGYYALATVTTAGAICTIGGDTIQGYKGDRYFSKTDGYTATPEIIFTCPAGRSCLVYVNKLPSTGGQIQYGTIRGDGSTTLPYLENLSSIITNFEPLTQGSAIRLVGGDYINSSGIISAATIVVHYDDSLTDPVTMQHIVKGGETIELDSATYGGYGHMSIAVFKSQGT